MDLQDRRRSLRNKESDKDYDKRGIEDDPERLRKPTRRRVLIELNAFCFGKERLQRDEFQSSSDQ